jgi:hypothetical protein
VSALTVRIRKAEAIVGGMRLDTDNGRYTNDPVAFAIDKLGFQPDPWQAEVMSSKGNVLLNCSRQSGKSTTTSVIGLHTALYRPGALVLMVSPSLRQSRELFGKLTGFLKRMDPQPRLVEDNYLSLTLENGSRVVALPGSADTIRGFSAPAVVIEDEAAFVDDGLYRAVRPMLAVSSGRLILMSTPAGQRGHFHEAWNAPAAPWQRIQVKATDCSRIPKAFLDQERIALGDFWFRQEYGCEFLETSDQLFRLEDIERSFSDEVTPLFGGEWKPSDVAPLFGSSL